MSDDTGPCGGAPRFDLTSGAHCLDFVNTLENRGGEDVEALHSYEDLATFACEAGMLDEAVVLALLRRAGRESGAAAEAVCRAVALREALYRLLTGHSPEREAADLELLNGELAVALAARRLRRGGKGWSWSWASAVDLGRPLWPVLRSVSELLTSEELGAVRTCAAERCSWLFMDRSRNRSRRWCDMRTCGNRAKARRHYVRKKAGGATKA
jgi:predicted RNA-binding Zn ribbon-like protein